MDLEQLIKELGLQFRNLIQHSDGRWSCKLLHRFKETDEFWGDTPIEAVKEAVSYLEALED